MKQFFYLAISFCVVASYDPSSVAQAEYQFSPAAGLVAGASAGYIAYDAYQSYKADCKKTLKKLTKAGYLKYLAKHFLNGHNLKKAKKQKALTLATGLFDASVGYWLWKMGKRDGEVVDLPKSQEDAVELVVKDIEPTYEIQSSLEQKALLVLHFADLLPIPWDTLKTVISFSGSVVNLQFNKPPVPYNSVSNIKAALVEFGKNLVEDGERNPFLVAFKFHYPIEYTLTIPGCEELAEINLYGHGMLIAMSEGSLAECPNLERVNFTMCTQLTDAIGAELAQCPNLREVNFSGCTKLTDATATELAKCPNLRKVNFSGCTQLTDATATELAKCPNLREVNFSGCTQLTDATAVELVKCPNLTSLNFRGCLLLTNAIDKELAKSTSLKEVIFWQCPLLTRKGLCLLCRKRVEIFGVKHDIEGQE